MVDLCLCARSPADASHRWPKLPRDTYGWRNRTTASFIYFRAASWRKFAGQRWGIAIMRVLSSPTPLGTESGWDSAMAGSPTSQTERFGSLIQPPMGLGQDR